MTYTPTDPNELAIKLVPRLSSDGKLAIERWATDSDGSFGPIHSLIADRLRKVMEWEMDTRDAITRQALIRLGWTPPEAEANGDPVYQIRFVTGDEHERGRSMWQDVSRAMFEEKSVERGEKWYYETRILYASLSIGKTLHESMVTPWYFESPATGTVWTYKRQPGNHPAYRMGEACSDAMKHSAGDYIDRGLVLLKELHDRGYGIISLAASASGVAI